MALEHDYAKEARDRSTIKRTLSHEAAYMPKTERRQFREFLDRLDPPQQKLRWR